MFALTRFPFAFQHYADSLANTWLFVVLAAMMPKASHTNSSEYMPLVPHNKPMGSYCCCGPVWWHCSRVVSNWVISGWLDVSTINDCLCCHPRLIVCSCWFPVRSVDLVCWNKLVKLGHSDLDFHHWSFFGFWTNSSWFIDNL